MLVVFVAQQNVYFDKVLIFYISATLCPACHDVLYHFQCLNRISALNPRNYFLFGFFPFLSSPELAESNVKLKLTIVNTVGFGDQINKEDR